MRIVATRYGFRRDYSYRAPKAFLRCRLCNGQFVTLRDGLCVYNGCYKTVTSEG